LDKDLHVQVPEELHRWLRIEAAKRHVKMRQVVEEALRFYRDHPDGASRHREEAANGEEA